MLWTRILKLWFACVKNLGHSVFYNVTVVSALILFLAELIDAVFVEIPPWAQPYVRWTSLGVLLLVCFLFVYGYIRSKWIRKALVWVSLIEKYKETPLLDPYWEEHQRRRCGCCPPNQGIFLEEEDALAFLGEEDTLARKLENLQTQMGLVIGAVETGDLTLKDASIRCNRFINAAWGIVNDVTKNPSRL